MVLILRKINGQWFRELKAETVKVREAVKNFIQFIDPNTIQVINEDVEIVGLSLGRNKWDVEPGLPQNVICFDYENISAKHCLIIKSRGIWYIQDYSSTGTRIKRNTGGPAGMYRILLETGWYPLQAGDKIVLGAGNNRLDAINVRQIIELEVVRAD